MILVHVCPFCVRVSGQAKWMMWRNSLGRNEEIEAKERERAKKKNK